MAGDTRSRMIEAAVDALRRYGVAGMSFTEVLRDSGAARGAIYHHFPGGKAQLVAEAAAQNGQDVRANLASLPAETPLGVVEAFLDSVRPVVEASATGSGCAVAAVTVNADEALCGIASDAFTSWSTQLTERLTTAGVPPTEAADLATTLITLLEGAQVLCRAASSVEPFDQVVHSARQLVGSRYPR